LGVHAVHAPRSLLPLLLLALAGCADDPAPPAPTPRAFEALPELSSEPAPAPAAGGPVAGEVRSQSGRPGLAERVVLLQRGAEGTTFETARVDYELGRVPAVGRFRFEHVPPGSYELSAAATVAGFAWERETLAVTPPAEDLVLTLLDAGQRAWIELAAVGRDSNRPVPELTLHLFEDLPGAAPLEFTGTGSVSAGLQRADPGLRWRLSARGYLPAQGTRAELEPAGERDGHPVLRRELELVPGWTARLRVRFGWTQPLPGARVSIDDVPVGATDAEGLLDLRRDAPPRVLRVDAQGFRPYLRFGVDGMTGDAGDWGAPPVLDVPMQRP